MTTQHTGSAQIWFQLVLCFSLATTTEGEAPVPTTTESTTTTTTTALPITTPPPVTEENKTPPTTTTTTVRTLDCTVFSSDVFI